MKTYMVVRNIDNIIINSVIWDGIASWENPYPNSTLVQYDGLFYIGDKYENGKFYYWHEGYQDWIDRNEPL